MNVKNFLSQSLSHQKHQGSLLVTTQTKDTPLLQMGTYRTGNGREVKMRSLHERLVGSRRISHHQELRFREAGMHLGSEGSGSNKHGIKSHQSLSVNVSGEYDTAINISNSNCDKGGQWKFLPGPLQIHSKDVRTLNLHS